VYATSHVTPCRVWVTPLLHDVTLLQVIIQEGPGWVINEDAYQAHLKQFTLDTDKGVVYKSKLVSEEI
jgi:hypothetical protein